MDVVDTTGLVREALAGDPAALNRLVAFLTPVVQARVARTLLNHQSHLGVGRNVRQEVEDLTQEIFLHLFANGARVLRSWQAERGSSLQNFVGMVSERRVASALRSGKRNPFKEEPAPAEDLDAVARDQGPEEATASREQLRLLLDGLRERLSPRGCQLFELLFVRELSVAETMAASGLSAVAVYKWRSRLRRLVHKLRAELSGKSPPPRNPRKDGAG